MFCIITPIFDEAFQSVIGLIQDLKEQTYSKFQHILISNGKSPIIKGIIEEVNDDRFTYVEYPYESTPGLVDILTNIAKRRNYALESFEAERYFFFDADLYVKAKSFLEVIADIHGIADVIVSKIVWSNGILPQEPICAGHIDIANYAFSKKMRNKYKYPTDYNLGRVANDWKFYDLMKNESHCINDMVYAIKDGRSLYKNLTARLTVGLFL